MFRTFHIKVNHIKEKRRRFLRTHRRSGKIRFEVYRGSHTPKFIQHILFLAFDQANRTKSRLII